MVVLLRWVTRLAHPCSIDADCRKELGRRGGGRAAIALCGGGGQGEAILLER